MIIAEVDFEEEDWSEVDGTGNIADQDVLAAAALASTSFGLRITLDGAEAPTYVYKILDHNTDELRFRFYFDPNSISLTAPLQIATIWLDGSWSSMFDLCHVRLLQPAGYEVEVLYYNDAGGQSTTSNIAITDAPHCIEVHIQRESSDGAADGSITLTVDGGSSTTRTGIENYNLFATIAYVVLGSEALFAADTGAYYVDELVVRDDNIEIGTTVYYTGNASLRFTRKMPNLIFIRED